MKAVRSLLRILGALLLVAIAGMAGLWFFGPSPCGNDLLAEIVSPDSTKKIVVFQRDCGATTGFSTQASLLDADEKLENEKGNIFEADTNHGAAPSGIGGGPAVTVVWDSGRSVVVVHHPNARLLKAEQEVSGVRFSYLNSGT